MNTDTRSDRRESNAEVSLYLLIGLRIRPRIRVHLWSLPPLTLPALIHCLQQRFDVGIFFLHLERGVEQLASFGLAVAERAKDFESFFHHVVLDVGGLRLEQFDEQRELRHVAAQ